MKNFKLLFISLVLSSSVLTSCASSIENELSLNTNAETQKQSKVVETTLIIKNNDYDMKLFIDDIEVNVIWENNISVNAMRELSKNGGLTINTHQYGGFEQVGEIGQNIVSENVQMTTEPGDIVLYNNSNIVLFYGSNSWSYTKLGKIVGKTDEELKNILNKNSVVLKIN